MVAGLSNFGNKDADVAMVKGVIALIAPGKPTCDLTHEISLQIILAGCLA
ncbi:MAG: SAM-dependent chlorinase/fluorinase [Cyanobacteria bacterium J06649_4]